MYLKKILVILVLLFAVFIGCGENVVDKRIDLSQSFALTSPPDNSVGQDINLQLSWSASTGAINYVLIVSANSDLSSPEFSGSVGNTVKYLTNLDSSMKYYWKVYAVSVSGIIDSSSGIWNFTTSVNPANIPADFALASPTNGTPGQLTNITFSWNASDRAADYVLQVSTNSAFTSTVYNEGLGNITSKQLYLTVLGTKYYWRVKSANKDGEKWNTGGAGNFTTLDIPSAFTHTSPSDSATGQDGVVDFTWTASLNAECYRFVISTNSDLSPSWIDITVGNIPNGTVGCFPPNTTYYWQITASNAYGQWSAPIWSFTTGDGPSDFTYISPRNGAVNQGVTVDLSWNASIRLTGYQVLVSKNSDLSSPLQGGYFVGSDVTTMNVNSLSAGTIYYWQVSAEKWFEGSRCEWSRTSSSGIWSFTTGLALLD